MYINMKVFEEMLFHEKVHVNIDTSIYIDLDTHKNRHGGSTHMSLLIQ